MYTLFQAIYNRLIGDEYINTDISERIFESVALEDIAPYLVIDVDREVDEGIKATGSNLYIVTIDVNALTSDTRADVSALVISLIDRCSWVDDNVTIHSAMLSGTNQSYQVGAGNVDQIVYINELTFEINASVL